MAPPTHGRPPGAPRKLGQTQMHPIGRSERLSTSSSSAGGDQSSSSADSLRHAGESSNTGLFTMPRFPADRIAQRQRDVSSTSNGHSIGTASWLSRRPPGPQEYGNSSAFADTPSSNPQRSHVIQSQHTGAAAIPSLGRPSGSRLYQDLTRGIATSRRGRINSRISAASSGWGSPKLKIGQGGRHITAASGAEGGMSYVSAATPGPSRLPQKVPNGVFDTPRTPSGGETGYTSALRPSGLHQAMHAATASTAINTDGSLSVVRDEEEANNSGLLGMSPATRRIQGLGLGMTPATAHLNAFEKVASPLGQHQNGIKMTQSSPAPPLAHANQSIIEHSTMNDSSSGSAELEAMRARLLQAEDYNMPVSDDRSALLDVMRNWREDAMKHHLYDTAIYWGDKILNLETQQIAWNDAYNLATAYFLTHRYAQAEQLLCTPLRLAKRATSNLEEGIEGQGEMVAEGEEGEEEGIEIAAAADTDWDDLDAAVAATRKYSVLPQSMLAKMDGSIRSESQRSIEKLANSERKRKERPFTISGTGTGSEGTGEGASGESATNHEDLLGGLSSARDVAESGAEVNPIMQAWKEEQNVAMEEIRERELPPPDSVSLVSISIPCKYLAAQCMVRQEKYQEALDELSGWKSESSEQLQYDYKQPSRDGLIKLSSSIWHLKGQIHLKLRNTDEAKEDFIKSLCLDVKNYESFDQLIRGNLLTSSEQWGLVEGLEFVSQAGEDSIQLEALQLVRILYTTRLDKTGKLHAQQAAAARRQLIRLYGLDNNADVLLGLAEEMFSRMKYEDAYIVTKRIMEVSKDYEAALPIYISTMYMIERLRPTLFLVAHYLTETDPDLPCAWYAVGCWYLGTKQWLEARKYFSKSVQMDPRFAPGWIAFAHTFSYEGETDQAIISYSTAERLFHSHHLIKLFVGMEHLQQANLTLAEIFLQGSAAVWEEDSLSRNERGVVQYYKGNFEEAIYLFEGALQAAKDVQQPQSCWSITHLNLGYAYRRMKQVDKAKKSFLQTIELDPDCSAAYTGVGMCFHREGDLMEAIDWYHRALAINTSDKQTSEMLSIALSESAKSIDILKTDSPPREASRPYDASLTPMDFTQRDGWLDRNANQTAGTVTMDEDISQSGEMEESL